MTVIRTSQGDIKRQVLESKIESNQNTIESILRTQNKVEYEILQYLAKDLGMYFQSDYNINYRLESNFKPKPSDYLGKIKLNNFINEFKQFVATKYKVNPYNITDFMWDDTLNNLVKPKIESILESYGLVLDLDKSYLYGGGDMLLTLNLPNEVNFATYISQIILQNPQKVITSNEFFGVEQKTEKRKFLKFKVNEVEYKLLLNPLNQDKYPFSGDKSILSNLFGSNLDRFLNLNKITNDSIIIQIHKDLRNYNFVTDGTNFYALYDVQKFKENENYEIKKLNNNERFYTILNELLPTIKKVENAKMLVFLDLGGYLTKTINGGLKDKRTKIIYHSYIVK